LWTPNRTGDHGHIDCVADEPVDGDTVVHRLQVNLHIRVLCSERRDNRRQHVQGYHQSSGDAQPPVAARPIRCSHLSTRLDGGNRGARMRQHLSTDWREENALRRASQQDRPQLPFERLQLPSDRGLCDM
jgi:hypothetical protein